MPFEPRPIYYLCPMHYYFQGGEDAADPGEVTTVPYSFKGRYYLRRARLVRSDIWYRSIMVMARGKDESGSPYNLFTSERYQKTTPDPKQQWNAERLRVIPGAQRLPQETAVANAQVKQEAKLRAVCEQQLSLRRRLWFRCWLRLE